MPYYEITAGVAIEAADSHEAFALGIRSLMRGWRRGQIVDGDGVSEITDPDEIEYVQKYLEPITDDERRQSR